MGCTTSIKELTIANRSAPSMANCQDGPIVLEMGQKKSIVVSNLGSSLHNYRKQNNLKDSYRFTIDKETIVEINCEEQLLIQDIILKSFKYSYPQINIIPQIKIQDIGQQLAKVWKLREHKNGQNPDNLLEVNNNPIIIIKRERFSLKSMMKLKQCTLDQLRNQLNLHQSESFCMAHKKQNVPIELKSEKKMQLSTIVQNNTIYINVGTSGMNELQIINYHEYKQKYGFMF